MARKQTININRFDGGMTDNVRDTSNPTKFAYISHFDIYRNRNVMHTMPGYVPFNGFDGNANGIKAYDPKDINVLGLSTPQTTIMLLAEKADGTGSKLFTKATADSEWQIPTATGFQAEGSSPLVSKPFLITEVAGTNVYYPVTSGGSTFIANQDLTTGINGTWGGAMTGTGNGRKWNHIQTSNGDVYFFIPQEVDVAKITSSAVTRSAKTTSLGIGDIGAGDYIMGIGGSIINRNARSLLWDYASLLADQNNRLGNGFVSVCEVPSNIFCYVIDEGIVQDAVNTARANGKASMALKVLQGESADTVFRMYGYTHATGEIYATKGYWLDSMTWYAKIPTNASGTAWREGVWAFGRADAESQMGVSVLLDTSSLGSVYSTRWIGNTCWFVNHSGDGSISYLDNIETGTYNVPATIETLVYGSGTPYLKELNGISVVTENLPASASIKVDYRTDLDSTWVELGTSSVTGKQKHSFTKAQGTPIGRFQEIQFRITATGKIGIKNIKIDITETDDLSF